jgi:Zn-dependent protease
MDFAPTLELATIDTLVAAGVLLCVGMLVWMSRREEQVVVLDVDGLHCGPRLLPWGEVTGLGFVRGAFGAHFRISTLHGVVAFRDRQLLDHPDDVRTAIVRGAGLVTAPLGPLAEGLEAGVGDSLQEWATPEVAAQAHAERAEEIRELDEPDEKGEGLRKAGVGIAALLAILFKFGKLLPAGLKALNLGQIIPTALSMGVTVWAYAQFWGAWFAAGFVVLILIHELGHALIMARKGLRTSPIVFVPFVGALIAVKDQFRDALVESETAYGGPAAGALAATASFIGWRVTGNEFLLHLSYLGFLLNLFNLIPVSPLDGGRIVTAVSPLLWLIGLVAAGALAFLSGHPILILIVVLGAFRAYRTWRQRGDDGLPASYYEVTPGHRALMALAYFGLTGYLGVMTAVAVGLGGTPA